MDTSRFVEKIFARLLVRYGAAWNRMWEGVEPDAVKADWERVLSGVNGAAIMFALEHLPADRPPTAGQFRALCISPPPVWRPSLPPPPQTPEQKERVRELLAKAKAAILGKGAQA